MTTTPSRIGLREARIRIGDLVNRVHYGGETITISRNDADVVALMPVSVLDELRELREFRRTHQAARAA